MNNMKSTFSSVSIKLQEAGSFNELLDLALRSTVEKMECVCLCVCGGMFTLTGTFHIMDGMCEDRSSVRVPSPELFLCDLAHWSHHPVTETQLVSD